MSHSKTPFGEKDPVSGVIISCKLFGIRFFLVKLVDCLEKCLIYGHIRRFAD